MESQNTLNPLTGRQWDMRSLIEKLLELQDALLQSQERNITMSAQIRELELQVRDNEDLRVTHDNQSQLLADKSRENKFLHQELTRMSGMLSSKVQELEETRSLIAELQQQLKSTQSDRDVLGIMLTEAENAARQGNAKGEKKDWTKYLKGK